MGFCDRWHSEDLDLIAIVNNTPSSFCPRFGSEAGAAGCCCHEIKMDEAEARRCFDLYATDGRLPAEQMNTVICALRKNPSNEDIKEMMAKCHSERSDTVSFDALLEVLFNFCNLYFGGRFLGIAGRS